MSTTHTSPFLTITETAAILRISVRTAYVLAERGEMPTVRVGGQYRVSRSDLERWLNASRRGSAAP